MNRKIVGGATGTVLGLVVIGVALMQFRNTSTEVDADDVVDRFESAAPTSEPSPTTTGAESASTTTEAATTTAPATVATSSTTTSPPGSTSDGPGEDSSGRLPLPEPGVYRLAVSGSESIDLLTGATHEYPPEGFLTVTPSECGVELRFDFIVERWQTWTLCNGPNGVEIADEQIFHSFFGQNDLVERACSDSPLAAGVESWSCVGERSVAERAVTATVETRPTPDGDREVLVVTTDLVTGDHPDNVETIEQWWDFGTGLPIFESRVYDFTLVTPFGDAAYVEDYSFDLVSFEPVTG